MAAGLFVWVVAGAGCVGDGDAPEPAYGSHSAPVVFGADDREDYYEASDPAFAELLRSATVALVDPEYIDVTDPAHVVPNTITLGEYQGLCADQRFADQPAMASCSGTLIDDDLVLTAAHCVDQIVCDDWYFVFDFFMAAPGQLNAMTVDDVYRCSEIVLREYSVEGQPRPWDDYSIVRLDRPVDGQRSPAPVSMDPTATTIGAGITVLGFGNGIPGKIHGGSTVTAADPGWGYFVGFTDTFSGNSGSGTYSADHEVVGVFVRGTQADYTNRGGCNVVNMVSEAEASQEYDHAYKAVRALCSSGYESSRLCGNPEPEPAPTSDAKDAGSCHVSAGASSSWPSFASVALVFLVAARRQRPVYRRTPKAPGIAPRVGPRKYLGTGSVPAIPRQHTSSASLFRAPPVEEQRLVERWREDVAFAREDLEG
jgi:V8-like Glu-specific endopeptidase